MSDSNEVSLAEAVGDSASAWLEANDPQPDSEDVQVHDMDTGTFDLGVKEETADEAPAEDAPAEEPEAKEETSEEAETDGASEEASDPEEGDGDYEKAISALRRGKVSKDVIGKLSRAEVLREGLAMAESQAAVDAKFDEHSRVVKELKEQLAKAESGKEPGDDVESTGHTMTATLSEATQAFADHLGVDRENVEPFVASLSAEVTKPMQSQIGQGIEVLQQLDGVVGSLLFRAARTELSSGEQARYPQLADSKQYAQVQEKAQQLLATGSYQEMDPVDARVEALSDAAGILLRPELERAAVEKATKERASREKGNVRAPSNQQVSSSMSEEERAFAVLDALEKKHAGT